MNLRVLASSAWLKTLVVLQVRGKSTMYEESAGIPLILAGQGVPTDAANLTLDKQLHDEAYRSEIVLRRPGLLQQ